MKAKEIAFKNALIFYSKEFYEEDYEFNGVRKKYEDVTIDQLPHHVHLQPIVQKFLKKIKIAQHEIHSKSSNHP
jgi:hypothetical protein